MNFRQIEAFRAVMVCGTASRAAEMLHLSQPAISRHIGELEAATRLLLFERKRGRLHPTAEAVALLAEVDRAFVGLERLRFAAENIRSFKGARLRVASMPALGYAFVPRVIGAFSRTFPDASVLLQIQSSEFVRTEVAAGNFDLGFAADEIALTGVEARRFVDLNAVCLLPDRHRLAGRDWVGPAEFAGERFVSLASEDAARARFDKLFADAGVPLHIVSETQYSLTICNLVRNGVGIGLINPFSLDGLDMSALVSVRFSPAVQFRSLLVKPPHAPQSRLTDAFIRLAKAERDAMMKAATDTSIHLPKSAAI
jgi:DNA-binding transcriptional LysR family regulator